MLHPEVVAILRDLNPWWADPTDVRPAPPAYRRTVVREMAKRLAGRGSLVEVLRGPRQVGKTTGIRQVVQDLLRSGTPPAEILFVRFDLEVLREVPGGLLALARWFSDEVRGRPLGTGGAPYLFLDEIHKVRRWDEQVKHLVDSFPLRLLLTGSSSVLVARGGRESLAGRVFSTEMPTFGFREVVEAWSPGLADALPPPLRFGEAFEPGVLLGTTEAIEGLNPGRRAALAKALDRYFLRGGYPRLHSGEVDDDRWADYLVQTVFENVLGSDIPDLFPVQDPGLLRHVYLSVARRTGTEISQPSLVEEATAAGYSTSQPTVGRYLHYLSDALLTREFRRHPLARRRSARVPVKICLSDLGVRNAVFRGAPSLRDGDPSALGPLVETLVPSVLRDAHLQVHFWKDHEVKGNRRSPVREVDFVAERIDGETLPVEVKFRRRIDPGEDGRGLRLYMERFRPPLGVMVTRDLHRWDAEPGILHVPLGTFLLAFQGTGRA
ncbi:MAG: ATP-binding protein [Planctomycetaceae bacterium]|nr:ATP-binding protein [Planctomycetota bacterium]NUN51456.1 ATP-binding protein [Planctomycetaceae bacterium]